MTQLTDIRASLGQIYYDEKIYYDGLSEAKRLENTGCISEEALEVLDKAIDYVDLAIATIHDDLP